MSDAVDAWKHQRSGYPFVSRCAPSLAFPDLISSFRIEYNKKRDKKAAIRFQKDETVQRNDMYKSHVVHVPSGEPPNSVSRPVPKKKPGVVKPITQGKLLRAGGPSVSARGIS